MKFMCTKCERDVKSTKRSPREDVTKPAFFANLIFMHHFIFAGIRIVACVVKSMLQLREIIPRNYTHFGKHCVRFEKKLIIT